MTLVMDAAEGQADGPFSAEEEPPLNGLKRSQNCTLHLVVDERVPLTVEEYSPGIVKYQLKTFMKEIVTLEHLRKNFRLMQ